MIKVALTNIILGWFSADLVKISRWEILSLPRMVGQSQHWAAALYLLILRLSASDAFLKGFDFVDAESPGRSCMVHGRTGVCMYSMVCTYAGGQHLGTCRSPLQKLFYLEIINLSSCLLRCNFPSFSSYSFYFDLN